MSVAAKRRPTSVPVKKDAPPIASSATEAPVPQAAPAPPTPVYWGDRYCINLWFIGAGILVFLHILDAIVWLVHR